MNHSQSEMAKAIRKVLDLKFLGLRLDAVLLLKPTFFTSIKAHVMTIARELLMEY